MKKKKAFLKPDVQRKEDGDAVERIDPVPPVLAYTWCAPLRWGESVTRKDWLL